MQKTQAGAVNLQADMQKPPTRRLLLLATVNWQRFALLWPERSIYRRSAIHIYIGRAVFPIYGIAPGANTASKRDHPLEARYI